MKTILIIGAWLAHALAFAAPELTAHAHLAPLGSAHATGTITFIQRGDTVQAIAHLAGLAPGLHAFHLHQHGDCTSAAATGSHQAPDGSIRSEHHGGEFGAIVANGEGEAALNLLLTGVSIAPGGARQGILGRSIVVHSSPDDFFAPAEGVTLACGVIRASSIIHGNMQP